MTDARRPGADRAAALVAYTLPGGWEVLAGRTDADNDYLSLELARPNDRWFHVRGLPGSHVVLRVPPGAEPDKQTLERAAAIAAFHSKARSGGTVPVSYTEARHVSKPKGAKPGTVAIRKELVLKVRPMNEATLNGLRAKRAGPENAGAASDS
jgi:predicted ribosome quality control (RQC) complex YloA/Tae2 family protein